jgi:F-type H+-transporting ATPase subunit epsilon
LVSPERILISADAEEVVVPGLEGQFTVLPGHAPVISSLRPGVLDARVEDGRRRVFVRGGLAEVTPERLTVLAQTLIDLDASDSGELARELQAAEQMLAEASDDTARLVAGEAVERQKALQA